MTGDLGGRLRGRRAVVVGVGMGFGRGCARALAAEGAEVLLVARSDDRLESIAQEITASGGKTRTFVCDAATREGAASLAAKVEADGGVVDVLVLIIGGSGASFNLKLEDTEADFERWRATFETNFWAPTQCIHALLPSLKRGHEAKVVTVNTMASEWVREGLLAYGASKAALAALVKGLAIELGRYGIRVNGVHPGTMSNATPWFEKIAAAEGLDVDTVIRNEAGSLGYLPDPDEVARTVLFLSTDDARPITGQGVHVNCGQWFS